MRRHRHDAAATRFTWVEAELHARHLRKPAFESWEQRDAVLQSGHHNLARHSAHGDDVGQREHGKQIAHAQQARPLHRRVTRTCVNRCGQPPARYVAQPMRSGRARPKQCTLPGRPGTRPSSEARGLSVCAPSQRPPSCCRGSFRPIESARKGVRVPTDVRQTSSGTTHGAASHTLLNRQSNPTVGRKQIQTAAHN